MADWDAEDFEPKLEKPTDKWEGEDEDDDIKDAWDADSDKEGDDDDPDRPKAIQRKKKKKLAEIIAEKEAAAEAAREERLKEEESKKFANTPEGRAAEKKRLLKMEENANLELAKDMLGLNTSDNSIDGLVPESKADFEKLKTALEKKLSSLSSSEHYPDFIEKLVGGLCMEMSASSIKKVKMSVEGMHNAKLKQEKELKAKEKKKGKGGGSLRMDTNKDIFSGNAGADYNDMDDFM